MFTPFAFIKSSPVPLNGLVAWYDAADYVSGTTWVDRSANGLDLTLSSSATISSYLGNDYVVLQSGNTAVSPNTSLFTNNTHTVIAIQKTITYDTYNLDNQIWHRNTWIIQDMSDGDAVSDYTDQTFADGNTGGGGLYWAVPEIRPSGGRYVRADETIQQPIYSGGSCTSFGVPFPGSYSKTLFSLKGMAGGGEYNTMISYRFASGLVSPEIGYVDSGQGAYWEYIGACPPQDVDTMNGKTSINNNVGIIYGGVGSATWSFSSDTNIRLAGYDNGGGTIIAQPTVAEYAVMMFYNRQITDSELSQIVDYYRPRFNFR